MNSTEQHLKRIHEKLQQLLKQYAVLQKENSRLKGYLQNATEKIAIQEKKMDELKQHISILKVSTGASNGNQMCEADRIEFEKRINGYLKEIDRCIALLGE
jgi:chromosome segregation ATPase